MTQGGDQLGPLGLWKGKVVVEFILHECKETEGGKAICKERSELF